LEIKYNNGIKTKEVGKMKEFRFMVEFADGRCDFRSSKGLDEDNAKQMLIVILDKQHESKMIKGKKWSSIEVQQ
jgi:hypothetical protein